MQESAPFCTPPVPRDPFLCKGKWRGRPLGNLETVVCRRGPFVVSGKGWAKLRGFAFVNTFL